MDHKKIDEMFRHGKYDKLIKELTEEQETAPLDEYSMFRYAQAYLLAGDEANASKIITKLTRQHHKAEYEELLDAIMSNTADIYIEECLKQEENEEEQDEEFPEYIEELFEDVVGLKEAKKFLRTLDDVLSLERERNANDFDVENSVVKMTHMAIIGERGSGKTMLTQIITAFLYDKGVRSGDVLECSMARHLKKEDDVRRYQTFSDTVIAVENLEELMLNEGIDENEKKAMLNALEELMEEHKEDLTILLTGNREAMEKMKLMNPAIENQLYGTFELRPYTTNELMDIMEILAQKGSFHIHSDCDDVLRRVLNAQRKMTGFMNARTLERMLKEAVKNMAKRFRQMVDEIDMDNESEFERLLAVLMPKDFEEEVNEQSLDELCKELDEMTGLQSVKKEVRNQVGRVQMGIKAEQAGAARKNEHGTLHMLFVGGPGTGKTTVASLVGRIYSALGVLPNGSQKIHVVSRADLISQYVGGTARMVKEACQRADGGVLFIDEAYSLVNNEYDSYGKEAVDTLIQEMENRRDSMMVIMAGYEDLMDSFLKTNPGLSSRIPHKIHFEDYTVDEMVSIFEGMVKKDKYYYDQDAINKIYHLIENKSKMPDFGNARGVRNLYEKVKSMQDERLMKEQAGGAQLEADDFDQILAADIEAADDSISKGEKTIEELLKELKGLTGLSGVKKQVEDIINSVQYASLMEERGLSIGKNLGTRHLIFSGNPGTGKSTVATLLGQIYVKLGVLKKNTFVLAKRSDLVGEFQGQTAPRVANKVAEADGGILFIDEAYQLYTDDRDSFGIEAVGTLLSLVEEKRDSLMVILAGYSENMERFLSVNPGLRSRFPNTIEFTDYNMDELLEIFSHMCQKEGLRLEENVNACVAELIRKKKELDSKEFANARGVRNMLDQIVIRQRSRIVREKAAGKRHSNDELLTITTEDVVNG